MRSDDATPVGTPAPDADDPPVAAGALVAGRYEIRRPLGAGGEAQVFLAHDRALDLEVVLKTCPFRHDDDLVRMRREAALLMSVVAHPGLPVVRSDAVEGDRYFMISDHVAGRDLHDVIAAQNAPALPLSRVLGIVDEVATALDHLHGHEPPVVHGDVKPENVIITPSGRAVLVDFGAAMRTGDERERIGTVGFSAPELLAGEPVGPPADVYSLAALAVHLLTGITPRPGASWPIAMASGRLAHLERVIRRGLTWDPLGRPWTAGEFAGSLRAAAEDDIPEGTVTLLVLTGVPDDPASHPVHAAVENAGGHRVTSVRTPVDATVFAFSRSSDAAAAAIEVTAVGRSARAALHAGDLGGRRGTTVQQLADETMTLVERHRDVSVLCSHRVRLLLGTIDDLEFRRLDADAVEVLVAASGAVETEPPVTPAVEVVAAPALSPAQAKSWIASRRASALVGRRSDLVDAGLAIDRQRAAAAAALLVVQGEPGMGKTRFLAELASRADEAGELVLVGRCTETGGVFEGFIDALGDDIFPFEAGQLERDEEGWVDRRRFFGRIASAIASQGRPVTLVIDDVQWIDGSSLALLSQLLDDVGPSLAVLAGCRPNAAPQILDALLVHPGARVLPMMPISIDEFGEMAVGIGVEIDDDHRRSLHALTAGNPFFAVQLLDHLRRTTAHELRTEAPAGVREWIRQRADRLGAETSQTLATAATIGRSFDVVVLADVLGDSPLQVVDRLDDALAAGLVVEGARPGEFDFVHSIVRTALADAFSGTRRGLLHAAIARRLEEIGDDLEHLEAALHHWLAADRLGDPLHAGDIAARVGTIATERLAHERATAVLRRSLEVLGAASAGPPRDGVEARIRVALGRALFVATLNDDALAELRRAADLAESADDHETLAHAALVASLNRRHGRDDPELLQLLERASRHCPEEPAVLPAMLHIRRSRLLPLSVPHEQRSEMARRGLVDVERMDPVDRAMVETEVARACWEPGDAEQRRRVTTRIVEAARRALERGGPSRWTGVLIEALNLRWAARVQLGDLPGALGDATDAVAVADQAGTTFLLSRSLMGEAMIRAAIGELEEAERLSASALSISDRHNLRLVGMAIAYCIGRDRGTQAELAGLERQLADLVDSNATFVAAFALVHAEAGNHDDALRLLDDLDRRAPWPRNWVWLATVMSALESALLVGDLQRVERDAEALSPYSGQWAIAAGELGCWGPVDRVLGLAAAARGDLDAARRLLIGARDSALANGATFWVARCHAGLAEITPVARGDRTVSGTDRTIDAVDDQPSN